MKAISTADGQDEAWQADSRPSFLRWRGQAETEGMICPRSLYGLRVDPELLAPRPELFPTFKVWSP